MVAGYAPEGQNSLSPFLDLIQPKGSMWTCTSLLTHIQGDPSAPWRLMFPYSEETYLTAHAHHMMQQLPF